MHSISRCTGEVLEEGWSERALPAWRVSFSRPVDEAFEEPLRPGKIGGQLFGVALDRDNQSVGGFHSLDRALVIAGRLRQPRRELVDRLVVKAVDADLVFTRGAAKL